MSDLSTSPKLEQAAGEAQPVKVDGASVLIERLEFSDDAVAAYLASFPAEQRGDELMRAISLGVHGLAATSMHATVEEMRSEVRRILGAASVAAESQLGKAVQAGRSELTACLDPEVRSSLTARTLSELESVHTAMLARLDPDRADSHTGRLVAEITRLLGPNGLLAQRLEEAFDAADAEQGMGRLLEQFDRRFRELRDVMVGERHRVAEAERGTAKGFEFEDEVETILRKEARALGGCVVERTGHLGGALGPQSKVGDFIVILGDGTRIAVEAKNTTRIALAGATGILAELDQAMDNREASWSVCISRGDSYPSEVGGFSVYGNRILLVDGGDGTLTGVALRWIAAAAQAGDNTPDDIDTGAALDGLARIRDLAQHFSRSKKVLNTAQTGIQSVRDELDSLRAQLLDLVDDVSRALRSVAAPRKVA